MQATRLRTPGALLIGLNGFMYVPGEFALRKKATRRVWLVLRWTARGHETPRRALKRCMIRLSATTSACWNGSGTVEDSNACQGYQADAVGQQTRLDSTHSRLLSLLSSVIMDDQVSRIVLVLFLVPRASEPAAIDVNAR